MLHIISYDLHGREKDYPTLYEKINALGEPYYCLESTVFLYTQKSAGAVDASLRAALDPELSFVVVDISGINVEKYFGSIIPKAEKGSFWDWVLAHKD